METTKVFENGRSQAVRLLRKYRFPSDEVLVRRLGQAVILRRKRRPGRLSWMTYMTLQVIFWTAVGGRKCQRRGKLYDLYTIYQYLHLRDQTETGAGTAATAVSLAGGNCVSPRSPWQSWSMAWKKALT